MTEVARNTYDGTSAAGTMSWFVDKRTQKLHVQFNQMSCIRLMSSDLKSILGFDVVLQRESQPKDPPEESVFPVDINAGRHTMFVYCS